MTKNTSVTASATFDQMPRPNHNRNRGARTTRGTAFSILIYGSKMPARIGDRPSEKPAEMPRAAPTSRPSSDSSNVTVKCRHNEPLTTHCAIRNAMSEGRLTKKASSTFSDTSVCQSVSVATPNATCQKRTTVLAEVAGAAMGRPSATCLLHRALALDHFIAKHGPQRAVEIDERRQRPQRHQIAWAVQCHRVACD